jgi:uncharacterized protein (TIGR02118 family)
MPKSICLLGRRPDITRAEFQRYYETRHAPLGARLFPFTRYVRNHLQDHEEIGFDTISEFWAEDIVAAAALVDGPAGDIMRADERKFMDQSTSRPAGVVEHVLAGPERVREAPGREKLALLLRPADGVAAEAFVAAAQAWGRRLGESADRVTLDEVSAWSERGFVCEAVLWVWPGAAAIAAGAPPAEVTVWRRLSVRADETPPEQLLG